MSRADLVGLNLLASAYVLGASQAATVEQARAYALLLLLLACLAGLVWLSLAPGIVRLQALIRYAVRRWSAHRLMHWAVHQDDKALVLKLRAQLRQADTELRLAARAIDTANRDKEEAEAERDVHLAWRRKRRRGVARRLRR